MNTEVWTKQRRIVIGQRMIIFRSKIRISNTEFWDNISLILIHTECTLLFKPSLKPCSQNVHCPCHWDPFDILSFLRNHWNWMFMSQIIRYGDFKLWTEYSNGSFLFWFNPTVTQGEIILSTWIQIITSSTRIWGKRLESKYPYFSDCWSKYFAFLRAKFFLKNAERIFFFLNKMNIQQKRNQTNIFYHGNICQECDY